MIQKSEIRKDLLVDEYVIIAPRRGQRPFDTQEGDGSRNVPKPGCVFCPEQVDKIRPLSLIGQKKQNWRVRAIKNIFPAVSLDNPRAYGVQEVVIETPDHTKQLDDLPVAHIEDILRVYAQRTTAISQNKKIEYIMIFKNSGGKAGASIAHSHSQIFATNFIPPQLVRRTEKAREYVLRNRRCAYCDMMKFEERGPRLIYKDRYVSVFSPFASQNNYEAWIFTRRHLDNITLINNRERHAIAQQLKNILQKIDRLRLPYNYYFHQVVNDVDQHLYIKIRPRGSVWAGVEIGSGVIINPIPPEKAARYFRSS